MHSEVDHVEEARRLSPPRGAVAAFEAIRDRLGSGASAGSFGGPARLGGLTESDWTPDHGTIHDFIQLMGEEGTVLINEYVVKLAVAKELADPSVVVRDTTAQEAAIPHPSEIRLMAAFLNAVVAASSRAGNAVKSFVASARSVVEIARRKIRKYHLFAKTKEVRDQLINQGGARSQFRERWA